MNVIITFKRLLLFTLICIPINTYSDTISKDIFTIYRDANNHAFETGDNIHIKKLYSGDIESCWIKNNINYTKPIINPPIPADAKYSLTNLKNDEYNPLRSSGFRFHKEPTHIFKISYKNTYFSTCSNTIESPSTSIYHYIHINKIEFIFPGICPPEDFLESRAVQVTTNRPNELSLPFIKSVLNNLTEEEKAIIRKSAKNGDSRGKYLDEENKISRKYKINLPSMRYIKYELCKKN